MTAQFENDRLTAFEIRRWKPLGGAIRVEVAPRKTVLVGRNGTGKSLLLEGLVDSARLPFHGLFGSDVRRAGWFGFEFTADGDHYRFEGGWNSEGPDPEVDDNFYSLSYGEKCTRLGTEDRVWWTDDDLPIVRFADAEPMAVPEQTGLLSIVKRDSDIVSPLARVPAKAIHRILSRIRHVGVTRTRMVREEVLLPRDSSGKLRASARTSAANTLARHLATWHSQHKDSFDEFVTLCRRMGLFDKIEVVEFSSPSGMNDTREIVIVAVDGVNIGYLSEGTLRIGLIVAELVAPIPRSLILIDEPERSIHPGLLEKLLAILEAYSLDRQIICSTHSLQVVDWAAAAELRLVERRSQRTFLRALSPHETQRLGRYLADEGMLSEFVYGGPLDD